MKPLSPRSPALFFLIALVGCDASSPPATDGGALADLAPAADSAPAMDASLSPACAARAAKLQGALDDAVSQSGGPGAVLAVVTPDCGRFAAASGTSLPNTVLAASDVLRVGSVTKTFVAVAILKLVDAGMLTLGDALEKWLPGFPNGAQITIQQLLAHTSGIYSYTDDSAWEKKVDQTPDMVWTPQQLVDVAAAHPPYFTPGQGWHYSNTDYILLGQLLEKVTGEPAGRVLRDSAFDPAPLHSAVLDGYEPIRGTLAHGFDGSGTDVATLFDPSWAWTAGAVVASAGDLADWAVALYGGSILSAKAQAEMMATVETGMPGVHYGLGVFVWDASIVGGTPGWGHPGDLPGYHTQMLYLPEKKIAIVAIVNSDAADPNDITVAVLDILAP